MPSLRHPASSITCPSSSPISHLTSFSRRRCHNGWSFAVRSTLDPKSSEDRGACQLRRRSGCSCGTSTKQRRTPSGSATHISTSPPRLPLGLPQDPHPARRAPVAPQPARAPAATTPCPGLAVQQHGPTAPGTRHPGRRPCPGPAHCRTRGRSPGPACRGRTPGYAPGRLGAAAPGCSTRPWPHDHPADAPRAQRALQTEGAATDSGRETPFAVTY